MSKKQRCLCARILTICPDGSIVVIRKYDGHMEFPGGGMLPEDKDDPVTTALRELCEETGIVVTGEGRLLLLEQYKKDDNHEWLCNKLYLTESELRLYRPESLEGKVIIIDPVSLAIDSGVYMTSSQGGILNNHIVSLATTA